MTPAIAMGHNMNHRRQNIRSTSKETKSDMEDEVVTPVSTGVKTDLDYAILLDQGQLYMDLMGRFPVRSSKESWYTMMVYYAYCKCAMPVAMKSRSSSEWLKAYGGIHQELTSRGFKPRLQTMDNDASPALKSYLTENDISYQLGPPHCHRRNAADRAIHTFKEHFVTGLASVDPDFPNAFMGPAISPSSNDVIFVADFKIAPHTRQPQRTCMGLWITTKEHLLCQDAT
jgi:hypothetical protein